MAERAPGSCIRGQCNLKHAQMCQEDETKRGEGAGSGRRDAAGLLPRRLLPGAQASRPGLRPPVSAEDLIQEGLIRAWAREAAGEMIDCLPACRVGWACRTLLRATTTTLRPPARPTGSEPWRF
jgi:hypothetical protein